MVFLTGRTAGSDSLAAAAVSSQIFSRSVFVLSFDAVRRRSRRLNTACPTVSRVLPGSSDSLLQRYDFLVSMHRRVVRWHAFVVLRRVAGVRGVGWRETSSESAANDVNDQQHAEQRQYRDQSDRYRAPAFARRMMSAGRSVSFRRLKTNDK